MADLLSELNELLSKTEDSIVRRLLSIYGYANNIVKECYPQMLTKWTINTIPIAEMKVTISGFKFTIEHKVL